MTFLFFLASGIGVLLPYMTIHMKSLGITVEEIGIIYGVVPFFAILAPSAMGMIADKLGNFKVINIYLSVIFYSNRRTIIPAVKNIRDV